MGGHSACRHDARVQSLLWPPREGPIRRYPVPALRLLPLIPWTFFSYGLSQSSDGLVGSGNLIKKVYFLRLVIPLASVLSGIVDFCLAFAVLRGTMAYYGAMPSINILYLPGWLRSALLRTGNARRPACSPFLCSWPS